MSWFDKLIPPKIKSNTDGKSGVPEGLWIKCNGCDEVLYKQELTSNLEVCPKCGHHHNIGARRRMQSLLDNGEFTEIAGDLKPIDILKFRDTKKYKDRIVESQKKSDESEALIAAKGSLFMQPVVVAVFEYNFMGGSMGSVVGERFARAIDEAIKMRAPFICVCASGGARMQESLFSLMQMAKTSSSLTELADAQLPYISVLTNPTMGGVSASLAMLGDIIVAEPNALIGFAGPRVIESTVREKLPEGFQRSEFLLESGAIDMIVSRVRMRKLLARLVAQLTKAEQLPVAGHVQHIEN